jgi:hypothetical protein
MVGHVRAAHLLALAVASAALISSFAIPGTSRPEGGTATPESTAAAPVPPVWEAEARRSISEREYEASDAGGGLQAPNRAHGLRTFFEPDGARVVDREGSAELTRLRTVSVGGEPVGAGEVVSSGARVEVRRPGLVEWFVNSERGLEQGWTVAERPAGPLSIEVAFDAEVRVEGDRAVVAGLEYAGFAAWDAAGAPLAARIEPAGPDRVRITVDDAGATYPVTVDPTLSSPVFATLSASQTTGSFGLDVARARARKNPRRDHHVAGAGDVNNDGFDDLVVGAPNYDAGQTDEGAAFVFLGGPSGIATGDVSAATRLEGNQASAWMGYSVAGAGDVNADGFDDVAVGAVIYDSGQTDEGAVFVFLGGPSGIPNGGPATANATLQSNQVSGQLGFAVAGAGDVNDDGYDDLIAGAVVYDAGQTDEGAALVFLGGPSGIPSGSPASASAVLQSDQASAEMGWSVAGAGDVNGDGYADVLVAAVIYDSGQTDEGAVFVFLGGAAGVASGSPASASATFQSNQANGQLGISVAGAGDTNGDGFADVVVSGTVYDSGQTDEGVALLFYGGPAGTGNGDPATADAVFQFDQANASFGTSVAGAGDVDADGFDDVIVGAWIFDSGQTDEGAAFLYFGRASGAPAGPAGSATPTILQQDQAGAAFGYAVAGVGDTNGDGRADIAVGAFSYDTQAQDAGAVFVYHGAERGLHGFPGPDTRLRSGQAGSSFGRVTAPAGDVNGDGYDDFLVGAPFFDAGQTDEGAVFIYHGGPDGIPSGDPSVAATFLQGEQTEALFGFSVARAGDTNGDGFDDVVVGAYRYESGQTDEGAAFVFHGGPSGIADGTPASASAVLQSDQFNAQFGLSVSGGVDINNDGFDDVVAGAPLYDAGQTDEGAVFVFHGGPSGVGNGTPANADGLVEGNANNVKLGLQVAGVGDVNGDGYADVATTAQPFAGTSRLHVYLGGFGGLGTAAATTITSEQSSSFFASAIAAAGDVNADGYADIVTGASLFAGDQEFEGAAFVFHGSPTGIPSGDATAVAATQIYSNDPGSGFGGQLAGAGDVDGDGFDDILVTSSNFGRAYLFLGGPTGVAATSRLEAAATIHEPFTSTSVAGAGDVDGDGFDDVVVGYANYAGSIVNEGGALVYHLMRPDVAGGTDTVGIYIGSSGFFFLRNSNSPGPADTFFGFGPSGLGWIPLAGDWDGDGDDTPGLYDPSSGFFYIRNQNAPGGADAFFGFGPGGLGWKPIVGDWDGDGDDTIGLYDPAMGFFYIRNQNAPGGADSFFGFGPGGLGWTPITGDWDGDGDTTIGLYDPSSGFFYLRNQNAPGGADTFFGFGPGGLGWRAVTGDWDGDGDETIGLYDPSSGFFYIRNANAPGGADSFFGFGPANATPLVGDWDGQ